MKAHKKPDLSRAFYGNSDSAEPRSSCFQDRFEIRRAASAINDDPNNQNAPGTGTGTTSPGVSTLAMMTALYELICEEPET